MANILTAYYSRTGNTEAMAAIIAETLTGENNQTDLRKIENVHYESLLEYDGIILGTPVYYGTMASSVKKLLDDSVKIHGKLSGKAGGTFSSSANIGGGNETALTGILHALLIHGMIIQGDPQGDHYGPVAINHPDSRAEDNCRRFAKRFSALTNRLI